MERLTLFNCEWNCYNGFMFQILDLGINNAYDGRALFSANFSKQFLYLNILFTEIKVFDKTV